MLKFVGILILVVALDAPLFFFGVMDFGPVVGWSVMIGTGLVGLWMLTRGFAFRFDHLGEDRAPKELLLDPLGTVLSGFLLVLPGPVSDCLGALLLVPILRPPTAALLLRILGREAFVGKRPMRWSFRLAEDEELETNGAPSPGPADGLDGATADAADTPGAAGAPEGDEDDAKRVAVRDVAFEVLDEDAEAGDGTR